VTQTHKPDTIQPYDSDHTALVHVLWEAQRGGITVSDADELASHIMRSKWMRAVREHAVARRPANRNRDTLPAVDDLV
jgi:hypothetical protein